MNAGWHWSISCSLWSQHSRSGSKWGDHGVLNRMRCEGAKHHQSICGFWSPMKALSNVWPFPYPSWTRHFVPMVLLEPSRPFRGNPQPVPLSPILHQASRYALHWHPRWSAHRAERSVPKCPPTSLYLRVFQQQSWGYKPANMGLYVGFVWDIWYTYIYIYMGIIPQFEQNRDLLTNKQWTHGKINQQ